jgi:cytidylate kinase
MEKKITIAIDGYSSCGKSTFAKKIAAALNYLYLDTGAMYRAVTLFVQREGGLENLDKSEKHFAEFLENIKVSFRKNQVTGNNDVYLNDENVEKEIRESHVSDKVSEVSAIPMVREKMVTLQREIGESGGIVVDGRDIGTVVFPKAELKIFMTADPAIRALRRYKELQEKGYKVDLAEIEENIKKRDYLDKNREISPLTKAEDAIILDNSKMTMEEQMAWIINLINREHSIK